ncbi:TraM recognition domain-containing protein (plasmid) [Staphylococcus epidermidis]|nr:TraM recognition domain-containing protein [Staphylococcus epidermidis]
MTLDHSTAKTISERCGYHTVTTRQQTSNDGHSTISRSRSAEKQPLISETELLQMKLGNTVVVRSTSRTKVEKGKTKKFIHIPFIILEKQVCRSVINF